MSFLKAFYAHNVIVVVQIVAVEHLFDHFSAFDQKVATISMLSATVVANVSLFFSALAIDMPHLIATVAHIFLGTFFHTMFQ